MTYAEHVAAARARLVISGACPDCHTAIVWLSTPRGPVPVAQDEPVRGSAGSVPGAHRAILAQRNGWVTRVCLTSDGPIVGWPVHRCSPSPPMVRR